MERRTADGGREVVVAGGQRRPAGVPEQVAFETLRASLAGALEPVVGACPACGQPMVGEGPRGAYAIPVRGGAVELQADGRLVGPAGPLAPDLAAALVREAHPEAAAPLGERAFGGVVILLMLVPGLIAATLIWFVFWYLANFSNSP